MIYHLGHADFFSVKKENRNSVNKKLLSYEAGHDGQIRKVGKKEENVKRKRKWLGGEEGQWCWMFAVR